MLKEFEMTTGIHMLLSMYAVSCLTPFGVSCNVEGKDQSLLCRLQFQVASDVLCVGG